MARTFEAADLFCGAGGTSTGMIQAAHELGISLNLLAINHWPIAVNSHSLNHPFVRHKCQSLDDIRPREVVPGGRLRIMAASPECTHHSLAAGGRPKKDQSRATAWHVCRWASDLTIDDIFIENVCEFLNWGPLYTDHNNGCKGIGDVCKRKCHFNKPIPERKGETFAAWIQALRSMNYRVEWRKQVAAKFGDPTSRQRLIIMARRGGGEIPWPEETHGPGLKPYRAAREVIDWDLKGESIFTRKKPLSPNTLRRIAAGLKKFGGDAAEPFLVMLYGTNKTRSLDKPMPTVTSGGNHIGLVQPFLIQTDQTGGNGSYTKSLDDPLGTVVTKQNMALIQPFLVQFNEGAERRTHSLDKPLPTQTTNPRFGLCEPFIVGAGGPARSGEPASIDKPLGTILTRNDKYLVEPFVIHTNHEGGDRCHNLKDPLPTVTGGHNGEMALVEPFLAKYYGTGICTSVEEPLDTVTSKDRFLLVEPTQTAKYKLDIRLRMLQPHELSAAMSFPKGYKFYGNKAEQIKQIGNAVAVQLSRAHMMALLSN